MSYTVGSMPLAVNQPGHGLVGGEFLYQEPGGVNLIKTRPDSDDTSHVVGQCVRYVDDNVFEFQPLCGGRFKGTPDSLKPGLPVYLSAHEGETTFDQGQISSGQYLVRIGIAIDNTYFWNTGVQKTQIP